MFIIVAINSLIIDNTYDFRKSVHLGILSRNKCRSYIFIRNLNVAARIILMSMKHCFYLRSCVCMLVVRFAVKISFNKLLIELYLYEIN